MGGNKGGCNSTKNNVVETFAWKKKSYMVCDGQLVKATQLFQKVATRRNHS
jgi:hypothetical protein